MNAMQIKICGITNSEDALACAAAGVDMIGLNFSPMSLRCISPASAAEIIAALRRQFAQTKVVGVFVDQELKFVQMVTTDLALDAIQLHGEETPRYLSKLDAPFVIKALRIGRYSASSPIYYNSTRSFLILGARSRLAEPAKSFPGRWLPPCNLTSTGSSWRVA